MNHNNEFLETIVNAMNSFRPSTILLNDLVYLIFENKEGKRKEQFTQILNCLLMYFIEH